MPKSRSRSIQCLDEASRLGGVGAGKGFCADAVRLSSATVPDDPSITRMPCRYADGQLRRSELCTPIRA
jgi:hypothetical protein